DQLQGAALDADAGAIGRGAVLDGDSGDDRGARGKHVEHAVEMIAVDDRGRGAVSGDAERARDVEVTGGTVVLVGALACDAVAPGGEPDDVCAEERVGFLDRGAQAAV